MNPFGYPDRVWELFRTTPRAGRLGGPGVLSAEATTKANRNLLRLHVRMSGPRIADARFEAYGCPTTIAVGAWVAEEVAGRTLAELGSLGAGRIRQALEIPEDRAHCALLGEDVVQSLCRAALSAEESNGVSAVDGTRR